MAKDRHRRMASTLGCLVASMSIGAILLHWVQPTPGRSVPPPELIARSIKQPWQYVHIDATRADGQANLRNTHFYVDRAGGWSYTETWAAQAQLGQKGVIHVALQAAPDSNQITPAQWNMTQRLLKVLLKECGIPGRHVFLSDALSIPATSDPSVQETEPVVGQVSMLQTR